MFSFGAGIARDDSTADNPGFTVLREVKRYRDGTVKYIV